MARIFITGSADGLGQLAGKLLVDPGHLVVLHARNAERGRDALSKVKGAENVLLGDMSSMEETKKLADEVNAMGPFDAVIHNAGVYRVLIEADLCSQYIGTIYSHLPNSKTETFDLPRLWNASTWPSESGRLHNGTLVASVIPIQNYLY